jgi:hypothetical protein
MMLKPIIAVLAGTFAAFLSVFLLEQVKHRIWPIPSGLRSDDAVAIAAYMANLSVGELLSLLIIWSLAMFIGVFTACKIAPHPARWPAWIVALLFAAATIANFVLLPHPLWLMLASAIALPAAGAFALRLAHAARPAA